MTVDGLIANIGSANIKPARTSSTRKSTSSYSTNLWWSCSTRISTKISSAASRSARRITTGPSRSGHSDGLPLRFVACSRRLRVAGAGADCEHGTSRHAPPSSTPATRRSGDASPVARQPTTVAGDCGRSSARIVVLPVQHVTTSPAPEQHCGGCGVRTESSTSAQLRRAASNRGLAMTNVTRKTAARRQCQDEHRRLRQRRRTQGRRSGRDLIAGTVDGPKVAAEVMLFRCRWKCSLTSGSRRCQPRPTASADGSTMNPIPASRPRAPGSRPPRSPPPTADVRLTGAPRRVQGRR